MSESQKGGGARAAAAIVLLLLALAAVALLLARPDEPEGRPVAAVGTASGGPRAPGVEVRPGDVTAIDLHGPARDALGLEAPGRIDAGAAGAAGPEGAVVDGRGPTAASADPITRATGLRGRVLGSDGAPLAGARVSVRGTRPDAGGMMVMTMRPGPDGEMELTSPGEVRVEATAGQDGAWEALGLDPAFRYTLVAPPPAERADDLLAARRPAPPLKAGQVVDAGELRLQRAARVSGTVRDPQGRPVEGATVRLGGGDGPILFGGEGEGGGATGGFAVRKAVRVAAPAEAGEGGGPPVGDLLLGGQTAKTDAAGRYTITRVKPGKQPLTASKQGLRTARRELEVAEGEARDDVDLQLGEPLAVTVQVVDAQGVPIAGATVQASVGFGPGGGKAQQTDAQGIAKLEGLSSSEVTLAARADGYAAAAQEARLGPGDPATPRRLVLRAGCVVTGRLVSGEGGAPVTRGFVFLEPLVHGPDVDIQAGDDNRVDGEGRFRLSGVAPGRYKLRAQSPGLAPAERECAIPPGVPTVDLGDVRLSGLVGLAVVVLDPDGAPVEGASVDAGRDMGGGGMMIAVSVGDGDGPPLPLGGARGRTDAAGRVSLKGLQPGTVSVRASKPPFADASAQAAVQAGAARPEVTLRLFRPGRIDGRVLGLDAGQRATVQLLRRGGHQPLSTTQAALDGAFAFERVAPGEYGLTTAGPVHGAPPDVAWFTLAEGETVTRSVDAAPTATVEGTVTDAAGAPVAGASVVLGWLDAWHPGDPEVRFVQARATTDGGGRYRLGGVRPQPALGLMVTTAQGAKTSYRVEVPTAATVRRDLRLPAPGPGASVRVRVTSPDQPGGVTTGATVTLERQDDGPYARRETTTGPDGAAVLEGVAAGRYTVSAVAPGFARARATLDLSSATGATVDGPTLALSPGGALLLEVHGQGTGEARLVLRPEGSSIGSDVWFTGVSLNGQARIDGLEVGARYEVLASAPGHRDARVVVSCDRPEPQAPVVITLQPGS